MPAVGGDDLIDAIGELIAPVLDRYHGFGQWTEAAIDIGNLRHCPTLALGEGLPQGSIVAH